MEHPGRFGKFLLNDTPMVLKQPVPQLCFICCVNQVRLIQRLFDRTGNRMPGSEPDRQPTDFFFADRLDHLLEFCHMFFFFFNDFFQA